MLQRSLHPVLLAMLCACGNSAAVTQVEREVTYPDLRLETGVVRSWSGHVLRAVTTADRIDVFREAGTPGALVARDAGVLLVTSGMRLTAPWVTGNLLSGQFEGTGGVFLEGSNSLRARSPRVAFDRTIGDGGLAWSDAGVVLTQPGLRLDAAGFTLDLAEDHSTFDQVKTRFN